MRRLGVRVPHGAPMKIVLRQKSYFYCKNIKSVGTRTQRSASPPSFACGYAVRFALRIACCSPGKKAQGPLRRENVRWTLEQQRLQTCEACAGGRMHSIRKSPSWRANKNSSSKEELFLFVYMSNEQGLEPERAAASERMSNGHSNSSVSKMRSMCRRPDA